jgi:hypothetical protein
MESRAAEHSGSASSANAGACRIIWLPGRVSRQSTPRVPGARAVAEPVVRVEREAKPESDVAESMPRRRISLPTQSGLGFPSKLSRHHQTCRPINSVNRGAR